MTIAGIVQEMRRLVANGHTAEEAHAVVVQLFKLSGCYSALVLDAFRSVK